MGGGTRGAAPPPSAKGKVGPGVTQDAGDQCGDPTATRAGMDTVGCSHPVHGADVQVALVWPCPLVLVSWSMLWCPQTLCVGPRASCCPPKPPAQLLEHLSGSPLLPQMPYESRGHSPRDHQHKGLSKPPPHPLFWWSHPASDTEASEEHGDGSFQPPGTVAAACHRPRHRKASATVGLMSGGLGFPAAPGPRAAISEKNSPNSPGSTRPLAPSTGAKTPPWPRGRHWRLGRG